MISAMLVQMLEQLLLYPSEIWTDHTEPWLWYYGCGAMALASWLWYHDSGTMTLASWLWYHESGTMTLVP